MPTVFGPWTGEFGWELARWNPACRYVASKTPGKKYAIGPIGHNIIYEFVDQYIEFDPSFDYIPCMNRCSPKTPHDTEMLQEYNKMAAKLGNVISSALVGAGKQFTPLQKKYIGTETDYIKSIINDRQLICIFPRQRKHDQRRNWPIENWIKVVQYYCTKGYHVMAFGGPEDSKLPISHPFFTDLIEYRKSNELNIAITALNHSAMSIAIQSGGIYLGLYAGNISIAFGVAEHTNRLKSEDYLKSRYKYVVVKDYTFNPQFLISIVDKHLRK